MKIMIVHISTFVVFLTIVHRNNGRCDVNDVNDWPRSCLANFRIGKQRCEPCESGTYGCNCSKSCPDNTYGPGCYNFCDCPEGVICDPIVGCVNGTHTSKGASYNHSARQTTASVYHTYNTKDNTDVKTHTTTTQKSDKYGFSSLKIVGISIATSMPIVVLSILVYILFSRRKVDTVTLDEDLDAKSINADVSETDDQNNDTHSYLTISDKSDRLYAAVHYDEVEDRKSNSPISVRSITEHNSSDSENSKTSESYLTPVVEAEEELKGDSPRSSDYEDVTLYTM
ncbi:uncharacterized protein LOC111131606 [Crassostrea virginica]